MAYAVALLIILAASFLCPAYPWSADEFISDECPKDSNYSSSDPYKSNLDALLNNLTSMSSRIGFSEHTEGTGTNKVYGLYLCPGDLPATNCSNCVRDSIAAIFARCPNNMNAQIWSDNCILQYSNVSFFGTLQQNYITWCDYSHFIQDATFDKLLSGTLTQVARKASADQTPGSKFATMEADLTFLNGSSRTLYTRAQCMPDLSQDDCLDCLTQGTNELPQWCQKTSNGTTQFGRTASSSCIIRYDTNRFYSDEVPAPAPTPALPPLLPPPLQSLPGPPAPTPTLPPLLPPPLQSLPGPPKGPKGIYSAVNREKNIRRIIVIVGICMSAVMLLSG